MQLTAKAKYFIYSLILAFTFICNQCNAQTYWQQKVNYKIDVRLDDKTHTLTAFETITYTNNSPNTLTYIYFHLWPNAYKNETTALSKQLEWKDHYALNELHESQLGYIDSLNFKVNDRPIQWELDKKNLDICKLILNESLLPGQSIEISTPFFVKIPDSGISRLGHTKEAYQITQWYPKPAVYDQNGWNPIPYLDQGEFYSEFGDFDVTIQLPQNYIVGATGNLLTKNELEFLHAQSTLLNKEKDSLYFKNIISDTIFKTIRYTQTNIHDFAWFADKRFIVKTNTIELPHSKKTVQCWAMYTPENAELWEKSLTYINDGVYYYSLWNGDYPYQNVTAVDGTISAGGGMEYPTITVIGNCKDELSLEQVIVHEIGHNWFYGILGSNERVHGWMDEGINTFNENRYFMTKYPTNEFTSDMFQSLFHLKHLNYRAQFDLCYTSITSLGIDQAIETHSEKFSKNNYAMVMYGKTGLIFNYLKAYLGDSVFDCCSQAYFDQWKFKHPQPKDIQVVYETISGKKLDWLFKPLLQSKNYIDYKITSVKQVDDTSYVTIKNKGQVNGPVEVSAYQNGNFIESKWIDSLKYKQTVVFTHPLLDEFIIDSSKNIPEINRSNNLWNKDLLFKKIEPIRFEMLSGDHEGKYSTVFWLPMISYNHVNKTNIGIILHNFGLPLKRFQYFLLPQYSIATNSLVGIGEMYYTLLPKTHFEKINIGLSIKSFGLDPSQIIPSNSYRNLSPYIQFTIGKANNHSSFKHKLLIQGSFTNYGKLNSTTNEAGGFVKLSGKYEGFKQNFSYLIQNENFFSNVYGTNSQLGRCSFEINYGHKLNFTEKNKKIDIRVFSGKIYKLNALTIEEKNRFSYGLSGSSASQDLFFEEYYFDRSSTTPQFSHQRNNNMGGFNTLNSILSQNWMTSVNVFTNLPYVHKFIGLYSDLGICNSNKQTTVFADLGIGFRLGSYFGIYLPLTQTSNAGDLWKNYSQSIRFNLSMNIVNKDYFKF